ncbi:nucleolar MIF4G domain-containing protein 1 [Cephus cinctus]|uniref:Nucleolar MIF4G domain-containing protein 1 n=1 Tax=Cephus cinctus TaxID=211228 RepID=A0AAJ7RLT9_CEPCN|nr:nucleolar MIF4G domain-containing protein 1 [Cephus cinctus]XP_015600312.1 nucleolar MIF4G domain-containing protein 1 [Cephus cinctus]XP_015600314.1 nucleolar MIF4G domain-containing protein 1 [Cephus cinctus]XP_015600315.1 nucleolar MIF4G domain-containing protein 1 [Cephus cinctus]XP_024943328.1 nucleolar MIF4G domain-containing protein 1 [Cephus cinctus]
MKKQKHGHKRSKPIQKTRKELRKEKRQEKKISRAKYYQKQIKIPGQFVLNPNKKTDVTIKNEKNEKVRQNRQKVECDQDRKRKQERLEREMQAQRKSQLKKANVAEDKIIKQLEKQLKLNKRKSKTVPKSFASDGLDYILDFCDDENRKLAVETEKQLTGIESGSEFEEDFAVATGTYSTENPENMSASESGNFKDEENDLENDSDNDIVSDLAMLNSDDSNEMDSGQEDSDMGSENVEEDTDSTKNSKRKLIFANKNLRNGEENQKKFKKAHDSTKVENNEITSSESGDSESDINENRDEIWEDIYGRTRDKDGNVISNNETKYIPPAIRLKQENTDNDKSIKLMRLRKQLKGLLNRLAEHNMHAIASQVDELYMSNSRNDMNEMLSKLMMESIVAHVLTPDRLVAEHMMLITILHANVGTEVGAHFLLTIVKEFDKMLKIPQEVDNKELDNVILMIAHLYNFKVYGSKLLYQILEKISQNFTEKEVELILLILKTVGFALRKDNPIALKELILKLQQKACSATSDNSRVKFMLDVLLAIKNNNVSKIPQYDPSHIEHLKKLMKTFVRKGNSVTQFNIALNDLLEVNERGKWWIVGSAWIGNSEDTKPTKNNANLQPMFSQKILELARKQRMNTDIRRNIFCVLMTAEDYLDAFEKLHHLGLKDQQEREIIYVIMDCCLQEKKFNPYYAVLAQKFCDCDRKYQMTIQYTLWDKLKTLKSYTGNQLTNLARFLTHLFIEKGLPLSVLKVVQFGELDKHTLRLLRQIVLGILLHKSAEACEKVFERIALSPQLQAFREGLRLFISHFLVKNMKRDNIPEEEVRKLQKRAEVVDKILTTKGSKLIF